MTGQEDRAHTILGSIQACRMCWCWLRVSCPAQVCPLGKGHVDVKETERATVCLYVCVCVCVCVCVHAGRRVCGMTHCVWLRTICLAKCRRYTLSWPMVRTHTYRCTHTHTYAYCTHTHTHTHKHTLTKHKRCTLSWLMVESDTHTRAVDTHTHTHAHTHTHTHARTRARTKQHCQTSGFSLCMCTRGYGVCFMCCVVLCCVAFTGASSGPAVGGTGGGADAIVQRARKYEQGNDYARAIETYLSVSQQDTSNIDVLEQVRA